MLHEQTQLNHSYVICYKCGKMWTRKKSVFGHFSRSNIILHNAMSQRASFLRFQLKTEFEKWRAMRASVCDVGDVLAWVTYLRVRVGSVLPWVSFYVLACVAWAG